MLIGITCLLLGCSKGVKTEAKGWRPAPGSPIRMGRGVDRPVIADLNGDGKLDIAVNNGPDATDHAQRAVAYVAILLGDGKGGFSKGGTLSIASPQAVVAVGDIDENGRVDLVVASHESNDLWRFRNDGAGHFSPWPGGRPKMRSGGHPHTHDLVIADVNADRHLDALTTNADDNTVSVQLGDGKGGFHAAPGSPTPAGHHPYTGLTVVDLNADGHLDFVVPNVLGNSVTAALGDGTGRFKLSEGSPWSTGPRPSVAAVGDVNGDGKPDILATHDDDALLAVFAGDGQGGFLKVPGSPFALPERAWGIQIADMNKDGFQDVVLGTAARDVLILQGDGTGNFGSQVERVAAGAEGPGNIFVADLDKDGDLDIVTGNWEGGSVSVILNPGLES